MLDGGIGFKPLIKIADWHTGAVLLLHLGTQYVFGFRNENGLRKKIGQNTVFSDVKVEITIYILTTFY